MPVGRPFSLSGSDFYPLTDICTKTMTYDEKVAYRAEHRVPNTIDKWIADGKMHTKAPILYKRGPSLKNLLWQDDVECILNIIFKEGLVEGDIQHPDEFTLTLRVRVPPTTCFLMHYWQSPTVVIDQHTADSRDKLSPEWLETVRTERRFWQSRTVMLEMMLYFARNIPQNSRASKRVNSWCRAMSTTASSLLLDTGRRLPILTRNTRRHKPRASDLSSKESQQLRKTLNEGSPSRRRK
ncbi:hypothetical protein K443DRAFT_320540 [Laccaria amethystina LaAM-08-1]|uniref:Uncharacterized protein n=1 Tax=Laccaria amethystina LaAM-08-1 TaxID=1095629 RepID=A0A0C9XHT6_9AGAR|nr:hypothetical protein K443DRAFT_320540 [Laccaria amethystina LaAM-08-1]